MCFRFKTRGKKEKICSFRQRSASTRANLLRNEMMTLEQRNAFQYGTSIFSNYLNASASWVNIKKKQIKQTENHIISKNIKTLIIVRAEKEGFVFSPSASKTRFWNSLWKKELPASIRKRAAWEICFQSQEICNSCWGAVRRVNTSKIQVVVQVRRSPLTLGAGRW